MESQFDDITTCIISYYYEINDYENYRMTYQTTWGVSKYNYFVDERRKIIYFPNFKNKLFKKLKNIQNLIIDRKDVEIPKKLNLPNLTELYIRTPKFKKKFVIFNKSMKKLKVILQHFNIQILFIPKYCNQITCIAYCNILFEDMKDSIKYTISTQDATFMKIRYRALINKQIRQKIKFFRQKIPILYNPNYLGGYRAKQQIMKICE